MSDDILRYKGKSLRFIVDDYAVLKPDLRAGKSSTFIGPCPKTGKPRGIIVNEYKESIELPYLKKRFNGYEQVDDFVLFIHEYYRRNRPTKASEQTAKMINERLRRLCKKVSKDGLQLLKSNCKNIKKYTDYEFDFKIDFYLSKKNRLYHPDADNVLCSYSDSLHSDIILDDLDYNDTERLKSFKHCYLFHDLLEHKGVLLDDLAQVDFIWVDYEFIFQQKLKGLMK